MRLNTSAYQGIMGCKGLTPETVSEKTGMPKGCVDWTLEEGFASVEALERLAEVAGVPVDEIIKPDIAGNTENCIEFFRDGKTAAATFSQGRYIGRIKKLAKSYPDECRIVAENGDGSILARLPVKWVRVNIPPELTEEERERRRQRATEIWGML